MSQSWQQPSRNNPSGQQPPSGFPPPQGAFPPPGGGYAVPVTPAPAGRPGLGVLAGLGAAIVGIVFYAAIMRYTNHEIGYVALVVGLLVGAAMGKAGGRNPLLPVVGLVFSLLAVWFGQLVGMAWTISHVDGVGFTDVLLGHFSLLVKAWKDSFVDAKDILFFAIAGAEGFIVTKRMAARSAR
jgi:hypothetical protein